MLADRIVERLGRREFRLYVNSDLLGVELCGALKNVVAIAAGAADGLGFGDNGKAGLITRGLAEMTRLGIAAGANPLTFAGWRGSATSSPRAARRCRATTASGWSWRRAGSGRSSRRRCRASRRAPTRSMRRSALASRFGVEMPIAQEVHNALFEGKSVQRCLLDLLARESKDELADFPAWAERIRDRGWNDRDRRASGRERVLSAVLLRSRRLAWPAFA